MMRSLAVIPLAVVLLSAPCELRAQSIEGTVLLETTGGPAAGVLVSVLREDGDRLRGVLTDEAGFFTVDVPLGRYRLRAERIGLQTVLGPVFPVATFNPRIESLVMAPRPVEIEGIMVDSRVRSCRVDRDKADRIQRWWSDVRTALDVSAALQREEFGRFVVERFERQWDGDLDELIAEHRRHEISTSTRPFLSAPAEELVRDGFVQGSFGPERIYYGPDADVILSSAFLNQHCFSLVDEKDRRGQIGLKFEPVEGRQTSDIEGTLWVDTTTSELSDLDFRYVNFEGPEGDDAGGRIRFQYLSTGAWIVSEWYIRTPETGVREPIRRLRSGRPELVVTGFFDGGGAVVPLPPLDPGRPVGAIRGIVYDRLRGGVLPGAVVSILGSSREAVTDANGRYQLSDVPTGPHLLAFRHAEVDPWGLGLGYTPVVVDEGRAIEVELEVPDFGAAARSLCLGRGVDAETIVVAQLVGPDGESLPGLPISVAFDRFDGPSRGNRLTLTANTDERGRFAACSVPAGETVTLRSYVGGEWVDLTEFAAPAGELTYREVRFGR